MRLQVSPTLNTPRPLSRSCSMNDYRPSRQRSCQRPYSQFSQGDILKGIVNPFEGKHVIQQKKGQRLNVVLSSQEAIAHSESLILAPISGIKVGERIYKHETVLNPNITNGLQKKSVVLNSQLFTSTTDLLKRSLKLGRLLSNELEKIKAGAAIALHPVLRDCKKTPVFKRGDIVQIKKDGKLSQGVVVSNDIGNIFSPVLMIAFIFERTKSGPYKVLITDRHKPIHVDGHHIQSIDKEYVTKKIGTVSELEMLNITRTVFSVMNLNNLNI